MGTQTPRKAVADMGTQIAHTDGKAEGVQGNIETPLGLQGSQGRVQERGLEIRTGARPKEKQETRMSGSTGPVGVVTAGVTMGAEEIPQQKVAPGDVPGDVSRWGQSREKGARVDTEKRTGPATPPPIVPEGTTMSEDGSALLNWPTEGNDPERQIIRRWLQMAATSPYLEPEHREVAVRLLECL